MTALRLTGIRACVLDAYGTLFDVNSAAAQSKDALGGKWQPLAELWRTKQLQYTWLRCRKSSARNPKVQAAGSMRNPARLRA